MGDKANLRFVLYLECPEEVPRRFPSRRLPAADVRGTRAGAWSVERTGRRQH